MQKSGVHPRCRYGVREALAIASEEGLESMWQRHRRLHLRLWEGLTELGLEPFVEKEQYRLVSVNTVKVQAPAQHLSVAYWRCGTPQMNCMLLERTPQ